VTYDVVALLRGMPGARDTVAGMVAAGAGLRVRQDANGALLQLCDDDGVALASIEVPVLVQVPGEVERLLGPEMACPVPVWWVEIRASGGEDAARIARAFADEMVVRCGGTVWSGHRPTAPPPPVPAPPMPPAEDA
jgi:hypothetical protein